MTAQRAQKEYVYVTLQKGMAINKAVVGGGDGEITGVNLHYV